MYKMEDGKMLFDDLLSGYLGDFGRYQRRVYLLVCIPAVYCAVNSFTWTFIGSSVPHRCKLTPWDNDYWSPPFNNTLSLDLGNKWKEAGCTRYVNGSTIEQEPCLDGYVWDNTHRDVSALQEWELVCDRNWIKAIMQSVYYAGIFVGSLIVGFLSDRWGRKPVLLACSSVLALISTTSALATNPWIYLASRFAQGAVESGVWQVGFVVGIELVGPSKRLLAGLLIEYFFSLGLIIIGLIAWAFPYRWQYFQILVSAPGFIFVTYYWLMPESPRWLLAKGRHEEAVAVLRKAGRVNKVPLSSDILHSLKGESEEKPVADNVSYLSLFRTPNLRKHTLIICYQWAIVTLIYYGISLNPSALAGDFYLSFILSALTEFVSVTFLLFTLSRIGRRPIQAGRFLVSGLALIGVLMVPVEWAWVNMALALTAKLSVVGAFCTIYLYTSEIFPTVIRSIAIGLASTCARVGGIASPFASLYMNEEENKTILLGAFGTSSILAAFLTLMLPETNDRVLPETLEDGEEFGSDLLCGSGGRAKKETSASAAPLVVKDT